MNTKLTKPHALNVPALQTRRLAAYVKAEAEALHCLVPQLGELRFLKYLLAMVVEEAKQMADHPYH